MLVCKRFARPIISGLLSLVLVATLFAFVDARRALGPAEIRVVPSGRGGAQEGVARVSIRAQHKDGTFIAPSAFVSTAGWEQRGDVWLSDGKTQSPLRLRTTEDSITLHLVANDSNGVVLIEGDLLAPVVMDLNRLAAGQKSSTLIPVTIDRSVGPIAISAMLLVACVFVVLWVVLLPVAERRWSAISMKAKGLIFVISAAMGVLVALSLAPSPLVFERPFQLCVLALAEANPASQGKEAWIRVTTSNGGASRVPIVQETGWTPREGGVWLGQGDGASQLCWTGVTEDSVELHATKHPWSGRIQVTLNGTTEQIDLYSASPGQLRRSYGGGETNMVIPAYLVKPVLMSLSVTAALGFILLLLATRVASSDRAAYPQTRFGVFALMCIGSWSVLLATWWPGLMSSDSIDQWHQLVTRSINDWHPAAHTLLMWVITRVWQSPSVVAAAQLVALATVVMWIFREQNRIFPTHRAAVTSTVLLVAMPAVGLMVITIWKDIPYSIALLAATAMILALERTRGEWLAVPQNMVVAVAVIVAIATMRHNGPPVAVALLLLLLVRYAKRRGTVLALGAFSFLATALLWGPAYMYWDVKRQAPAAAVPLQLVAAHQMAGTVYSDPTDAEFVRSLSKSNTGALDYNCLSAVPVLFDPKLNAPVAMAESKRLWALAAKATLAQPMVSLRHLVCATAIIWRTNGDGGYYAFKVEIGADSNGRLDGIFPNPDGLKTQSRMRVLQTATFETVSGAQFRGIWRPAPYLILLVAVLLSSALFRFKVQPALVFAPIALQVGSVAAAALGQDVRYLWVVILAAILYVPWYVAQANRATLRV